MPLSLPGGVLPTMRAVTRDDVLAGRVGRVTRFKFYLLDRNERVIGTLDNVKAGGSLSWSAAASVKGSGSITLTRPGSGDAPQPDWLNDRIKPVMVIAGFDPDSSGDDVAPVTEVEQPLGIWLAAKPKDAFSDTAVTGEVELTDKTGILDQDVWSDADGHVGTYTAEKGSNVVALVRDLITATGETVGAISNDPTVLTSDLTWDVGTTRLKIINDLLDAGGFFSLYTDLYGQFQASKYRAPADRPVAFQALGPFVRSDRSVMSPDFDRERDIYAVPNRYVAITQGDGEAEGLVGVATNTDPDSPFSYPSRGRWITAVATGVEAVDQAAADTYAARQLRGATQVTSTFSMKHLILPGLMFNNVVQVSNPEASIDTYCTVSNTTVPLDPLALAESTLSEVITI